MGRNKGKVENYNIWDCISLFKLNRYLNYKSFLYHFILYIAIFSLSMSYQIKLFFLIILIFNQPSTLFNKASSILRESSLILERTKIKYLFTIRIGSIKNGYLNKH